jgi:hypothetical protein
MNWRALIVETYDAEEEGQYRCFPKFYPPASERAIAEVQSLLGQRLPPDLIDLLRETNGVMNMMKLEKGEVMKTGWEIWPTERIEERNVWARSPETKKAYGVSFDDLLFFTGAGVDGILFAFAMSGDQFEQNGICAWYPIREIVRQVAQSLEDFVTEWVGGKMSL